MTAVVTGRPPAMELDGRYLGFEWASYGMVDFWRSCSEALGVPGTFAADAENSQGRLDTLFG